MGDIKKIFENHLKHLKFQQELAQALRYEQRDFVSRRTENMEFLGDKLIGTPKFRFIESDRARVFDSVLELDEFPLRRELHRVDVLDPERRKVASDAFNLTCLYLTHRFNQANIGRDLRHETQKAILRLLHYRFLGSLMAHYFPHEADRRVAEAAYTRLNYRFDLKKTGSWMKLIDYRCEDILSDSSIHKRTLERFDDDEAIVRTINDIQGRIREIVKKITAIFYEVKEASEKIKTRSSTVEIEQEVHIRDLVRKETNYKRYVYSVMGDRPTFIKQDLMDIAIELIHTCPEHRLKMALGYFSDEQGRGGDPRIAEFITGLTNHLFRYVRNQQGQMGRSVTISTLLVRLRSLYLSSKIRDRELIETRELGNEIIRDAIDSKNKALIASVRSAVMIYIVLRMFSMEYYTHLPKAA